MTRERDDTTLTDVTDEGEGGRRFLEQVLGQNGLQHLVCSKGEVSGGPEDS